MSVQIPVWWIAPEESGGIRTYTETLLPFTHPQGLDVRATWTLPRAPELGTAHEKIVHLQHEFGLFGAKLPGLYRFPSWIRGARARTPGRRWIATAHTVLDRKWRYRIQARGWRKVPLMLLNGLVVPFVRRSWMEKTWGAFDGVIVHSELQAPAIRDSGCPRVVVIPHFVPRLTPAAPDRTSKPTAVLFGYFSFEKGQDIAIRAWAEWGADAPKLILAGGIRRKADAWYMRRCEALIQKYGLERKVEITGYLPNEVIPDLYGRATIVLAPFRETSGSGSLATALGYHTPVLASNLPLNREIAERVPGSMTFFESENPSSLANEAKALFGDEARRAALRYGARLYADTHSPEETLRRHRAFYAEVLG